MQQKILLMGGSGFIGQALSKHLIEQGFDVAILSRSKDHKLQWDGNELTPDHLDQVSGIVNLCGQSIMHRWSKSYIEKMYDSRINPTKAIHKALNKYDHEVEVVINISAVGYYDNELKGNVTEDSVCGDGLLSKLCVAWEHEASFIGNHSRLVIPRLGVVFHESGGAFKFLAKLYSYGLGAVIGSGEQYMNWIHLEDLCQFITQSIKNNSMKGVYNLVSPNNISNQEIHRLLCEHSCSMNFVKVPSVMLRLILGEQSQMLTKGPHIIPKKLMDEGFVFAHPRVKKLVEMFYLKR